MQRDPPRSRSRNAPSKYARGPRRGPAASCRRSENARDPWRSQTLVQSPTPGRKASIKAIRSTLGGILGGIGVGDHQPDIMTDNPDALVPERCRERVHVMRHRLLIVAALRLWPIPRSRADRELLPVRPAELGDERPPHMTCLGVAMQEKHRIALAGTQIVQPGPIDLREAAINRARLLCRHGVTTISAATSASMKVRIGSPPAPRSPMRAGI